MKKQIIFLALICLSPLFGAKQDLVGETLFKNRCVLCHSMNDSSDSMERSGTVIGLTKKELLNSLLRYKAGVIDKYGLGIVMSEVSSDLSKREIDDLATYLATLK